MSAVRAVALVTLLAAVWPVTTFAQLRVLNSGGFAAPYRERVPAFEKSVGATVTSTPGSEILRLSGFDFVGPVPARMQCVSVFTAAVVIGSKQGEVARRVIAFLSSDEAFAVSNTVCSRWRPVRS